jgi:hypothetical protein
MLVGDPLKMRDQLVAPCDEMEVPLEDELRDHFHILEVVE